MSLIEKVKSAPEGHVTNEIRQYVKTLSDDTETNIALAKSLLDPDKFGFAVTPKLRDEARMVLGRKPVESLSDEDRAWERLEHLKDFVVT